MGMRKALEIVRFVAVAAALICGGIAGAQIDAPVAQPSEAPPATEPTSAPAAVPTPIPPSEVAAHATSVLDRIETVEKDTTASALVNRLNDQLPPLASEIDERVRETARLVNGNPSLSALRSDERAWEATRNTLDGWNGELTKNVMQLEHELEHFAALDTTWRQSLDSAHAAGAPPEVTQRVESVIAAIAKAKRTVENRWALLLAPQNRVAEERARVHDELAVIAAARSGAVNQLFARGSPPIWSGDVRARVGEDDLLEQGQEPLATQWATLQEYALQHRRRFVFHSLLFIVLAECLRRGKRRVDEWVKDDSNLKRTAIAFDAPLVTAAVLTIAVGVWVYPQAPQLLWTILFAAALVPAAILLRRLIEPRFIPALYALVVFYFVDQARMLLASQPLFSRLLFIAQMFGGLIFTVWFIRSGRLAAALKTKTNRVEQIIMRLAIAAAILFGIAAMANAFGYVGLADLIGGATLTSVYVGVVFYALTRIADGLIMGGLRSRPLAKVRMVQSYRQLIWRRARRVVHWLALSLWALITLELFSLRAPLVQWVRDALVTHYTIGSLTFSPGHLLALGLAMWAAFLLSRFLRFVLEEDVYPRFQFGRGVPYAISSILHYSILLAAFLLTIAALGYDLTTITVLAGAFGVGIAFGMQNIVNNFVSGLILLFERPVQVGDVIQLDDTTIGTVTRIGIRASIIHTADGAAVIVPNGLLISNRVTNWTLSSSERRIDVPIAVVPGSDPKRVIELLEQAAAAHPLVEKAPPPEAVFVGFAPGALNFELRAWTEHHEEWTRVRSDIAIAANEALARANIAIK